jgi:hypothetical protein
MAVCPRLIFDPAATFRRGSFRNQGQQVGFQNASGAFAPRQSPFHQCAVFRQAVNQSQRTTKAACGFGASEQTRLRDHDTLNSHWTLPATNGRQQASAVARTKRRVGLESRPDYLYCVRHHLSLNSLAISLPQ